ncbi:protealysin inhibitor emfourin [Microbacterium murale]|uniref:Uncharacterized protein n=1 Tax=Microbacterium murale TaxID=1081040 RepID=A0ABQ1RHE8_9MICO|nr:protealysin inhibitor emfourin [Microbacterium murale]GGD70382.1 hypothetical protein GCM10007269_12040 [Microbacterium murale]
MRDVAPPSDHPDEEPGFLIIVIRTGGVAGIRRRWQVEPPREEAPRWIELIDRCPWDAPDSSESSRSSSGSPLPSPSPSDSPPRGADRFVWSIQARTPAAQLERELPESALEGPWRQLVEAVRAATAP